MRDGQVQEVQVDLTETLVYRWFTDFAPAAVASAKVTIYSPDGSELVALTATGITISTQTITYSRTWTEATFPKGYGYRAEWEIVVGSTTYYRRTYFDVVLRHFDSQLADADLTDLHPYLADQLPSSVTTFTAYRRAAWNRIERMAREQTGKHPGDLFRPERFFECHRQWTLALFFFGISRRVDDESWGKYEVCEKAGTAEFQAALARSEVDIGRDKLETDDDRDRALSVSWER